MNTQMSTEQPLRFAIYTRYSTDFQTELSLEGQETYCREAVASRGGEVIAVFSDGAKSGWSLDREGFQAMRSAAGRGEFDAVMFWKFDRLARSYEDVIAIKILLRHEYGIKLYCVQGYSEDDDDSEYAAIMEHALAVFSAFYSRNLVTETKRGKKQRAMNGEFNGSQAPIGYDLMTSKEATERRPAGLYINREQAEAVYNAFQRYSTGLYSDGEIANWLMQQEAVQKLRKGMRPIDKDMVREMLQNRLYTGRVRYTDTVYRDDLTSIKRMRSRHRSEWFEGKHLPIVSDELFTKCENVRSVFAQQYQRLNKSTTRVFAMQNLLYCTRCLIAKPETIEDDIYGRMRVFWDPDMYEGRCRCTCTLRGYQYCGQGYSPLNTVDEQVLNFLRNLTLSPETYQLLEVAVQQQIDLEHGMLALMHYKKMVSQLKVSWEQGHVSDHDFLESQATLRQQTNSIPVIQNNLSANSLLMEFSNWWDAEKDDSKRQKLIRFIIKAIYVYDQTVTGILLQGDIFVPLTTNEKVPQETLEALLRSVL